MCCLTDSHIQSRYSIRCHNVIFQLSKDGNSQIIDNHIQMQIHHLQALLRVRVIGIVIVVAVDGWESQNGIFHVRLRQINSTLTIVIKRIKHKQSFQGTITIKIPSQGCNFVRRCCIPIRPMMQFFFGTVQIFQRCTIFQIKNTHYSGSPSRGCQINPIPSCHGIEEFVMCNARMLGTSIKELQSLTSMLPMKSWEWRRTVPPISWTGQTGMWYDPQE